MPHTATHYSMKIDGAYKNNVESTRFFGNTYLEVSPMKNMNFKTIFALDRSNTRSGIYQDYQSVSRYQSPGTSSISSEYENKTGFNMGKHIELQYELWWNKT